MAINWYPGHMNKARKELAKVALTADAVIELRDARIPVSSANPLLETLTAALPRVIVLSKADKANPATTQRWKEHIDAKPKHACLISSLDSPLQTTDILRAFARLNSDEASAISRKNHILITGIPNVGKSTLLNVLSGRKLAKTGNEPAITQRQQRIKLDERNYLIDTPGMLWPKLEDQDGAYKLAMIGSIRNTAVESEDIGWFAADLLLRLDRQTLVERYAIGEQVQNAETVLECIGSQRGNLSKHGRIDWHKASEMLLNDYRSGKLGNLSLEEP